jgi:hypothetical protein
VEACAAFTTEMAASENDYHSRGIIVIAICEGSRFLITHDAVQEAMGKSLGIPGRDIEVDFYPPKGFLLLLPSPSIHDRALSDNAGVTVGRAKL